MTSLIKRIKTLWKLSQLEITETEKGINIDYIPKVSAEKPKMAQIIKRNNPVQDFLEKTKE
jgi:hypothetical protein